jgi:hypothetical protein
VNQWGLEQLLQYKEEFKAFRDDLPADALATIELELGSLSDDIRIPRGSASYKQVSILTRSARAARAMGGAQWISCKSAKDRTSMLCTYEAAQLLAAAGAVFSDMPTPPPVTTRKMSLRPTKGPPMPAAAQAQAGAIAEHPNTPKARWHRAAAKAVDPHAGPRLNAAASPSAPRPVLAARKPSLMALNAKVALTRQVFERAAHAPSHEHSPADADEGSRGAKAPLLSNPGDLAVSDELAPASTAEAVLASVADGEPPQDPREPSGSTEQSRRLSLSVFEPASPATPTGGRHRIDSAVHPLTQQSSAWPAGVSEDEPFDSSERPVLSLANHLREHGVRLRNCQLNVGKAQYAFNKLQVSALPRELKPPLSVIKTGKLES